MKEFEPISREDRISREEKEAFAEMQRRNELDDNPAIEDAQQEMDVESMLKAMLTEQERSVIKKRFFEDKTLEEAGEDLGISGENVRQRQNSVFMKLRSLRGSKYLKDLELFSRGKDGYRFILEKILDQNRSKMEENEAMKGIFYKLYFLSWGPLREKLRKLDSLTFNQACDEIKKIVSKDEYSEADVASLNEIYERLKQILERT